jgi:hypothetical protein
MPPKRLTVTFTKHEDGHQPAASWEAVSPGGRRERGAYMPIGRGRIPHDLAHLLVEGHLGIDDGVWGLLARGATYKRGTSRRPTEPGRAIVRDNREALDHAEGLGNHHHHAWRNGEPTEVASTFERFAAAWRALPGGGTLTVEWPSLELGVTPPR